MSPVLVALPAFTAAFTALHAVAPRIAPENPRAFALSRGIAAAVLTVLGAAALVDALPMWPVAFLYHHEAGDWMRTGLLVVYGHLLSDFLWMGWSRWRHGIVPRKDLIIHHGLGVLAYGYALYVEVGYAIALIAMITELMPVTSGYGALGKALGRPGMVDAAARWRLKVLVGLRLPVWLMLFALVNRAIFAGAVPEGLGPAFAVAYSGLVGLMALDVYWIRKSRVALARQRAASGARADGPDGL